MREYAEKVNFNKHELRYASTVLEKSPLFTLEIPYAFLLPWRKDLLEKGFKSN